ncbi:uncharacterized protein LOC119735990 [Patiria miniata]|uniref:Integrase zinc-binding domain-containing protein n=1 Tax=Patiria miniata TaxID=46514 RepID=A0A914AR85_PATMI|nr:uncharacterized protein LOC119735990 [Patiria miniata]XP_038065902.1 uncharacterized protein LOC119735990 [Patiria miniata]
MTEALTPLQLCGFDPLPDSHNQVRENEPTDVNPQSTILGLLQLQASMQQVILQQFQEINALKATISQVIGEQQRQRDYVRRLEYALHHSKVVPEASPVPEIPNPPSAAEVPIPQVPTKEPEPQILHAPEVTPRSPREVPTIAPTVGQSSHGDGGTRCGPSLQAAQQQDPAIQKVVDMKRASPRRISRRKMAHQPKVVQRLLQQWDCLEVKGGVLFFRTGRGTQARYLTVLPRGMREDIFRHLHHNMETCSYGQVLKVVRQRYFWPSLHNETMGYMRQHLKRVRQHEVSTAVSPPSGFQDEPSPVLPSHESQDKPSPASPPHQLVSSLHTITTSYPRFG